MGEKKPTILVVDDEKDFRDIISTKLKREGFNVVEAENGEEGVKKAKEVKPDLILMDVRMPKMSGMEALSKMIADKNFPYLKVFFLTNLGGPEGEEAESEKFAKEMGALGYIRKTEDLDKIVDKVKNALAT